MPKDLSHANALCCEEGRINVSMYAFAGDTINEVAEESSDMHCLRASLSEHDFESVGGLSARAFLLNYRSC